VGRARKFLADHLSAWGLPQLTDSAGLVLSELVTNALAHGHPPIGNLIATRLERLERLDPGVRIEVHDAGGRKPERRAPAPDAVSGRGLALVDALTRGEWGVSDREGPGKVVWAIVRRPGTGAER
jgi:two-component sensor histidine kinase